VESAERIKSEGAIVEKQSVDNLLSIFNTGDPAKAALKCIFEPEEIVIAC